MIGIVTAMKIEAEPFLRNGVEEERVIAGKTFYKLKGKEAVLALCGVGKVNASYTTALLISEYKPDLIVNCGVSGGIVPGKVEILDMVVATSCVQHDVDTSPLGDPKGLVSTVNVINFPTDGSLVKELRGEFKFGTVLSGEQFIADKDRKEEIVRLFDGIACDMESGAIAQCAYIADIPYLCVRCISDAGDGHAPDDFGKFCAVASDKLYVAVEGIINK